MKVIAESYWKNNQFASICACLILEVEGGHRLRVSIDSGRCLQGASRVERWIGTGWSEVHTVWNFNELKCAKNFRNAIRVHGPDETDLTSDIFAEDVEELVRVAKTVMMIG